MADTKLGRPEFEPTDAQREDVEIMLGSKMTEDEIARALKISIPTLRKHFRDELDNGFAFRRATARIAQYRLGMSGNASALKAWLAHGDDHYQAPRLDEQPKEEKLGKKAQQQIAADNPDTSTSIGQLMAQRAEATKPH